MWICDTYVFTCLYVWLRILFVCAYCSSSYIRLNFSVARCMRQTDGTLTADRLTECENQRFASLQT